MLIISSARNTVRRITRLAAEICIILSLIYLESILPFNLLLPFPGFKLGLSNIVIMLSFYIFSMKESVVLLLSRVLIMFLLFGNPTSALLSFCGSMFMFIGLILGRYIFDNYLSFWGISIICATLHNVGQIFGACILLNIAALSYLPIMIVASLIFGSITGLFMNAFYPKIKKICMNARD